MSIKRPYVAGRRFEYQVLADLRAHGWIAQRTPGSKGPYDGFALRAGRIPVLWQAKRNSRISTGERTRLITAAMQAGADPVIVRPAAQGEGPRYSDAAGGREWGP